MMVGTTLPQVMVRSIEAQPLREEGRQPTSKPTETSFAQAMEAVREPKAQTREPKLPQINHINEPGKPAHTLARNTTPESRRDADRRLTPAREKTSDKTKAELSSQKSSVDAQERSQPEETQKSNASSPEVVATGTPDPTDPRLQPPGTTSADGALGWMGDRASTLHANAPQTDDSASIALLADGFPVDASAPRSAHGNRMNRFAPEDPPTRGVGGKAEVLATGDAATAPLAGSTTKGKSDSSTWDLSFPPKESQLRTELRMPASADNTVFKAGDVLPQWASALVSNPPSSGTSSSGEILFITAGSIPSAPDFAYELSADVQLMLSQGVSKAALSLNPVDLGPIFIELTVREHVAEVAFTVANPATRDTIEQTIAHLDELLANKGVTLGGSSVTDDRPKSGRDHEPRAGTPTRPHDTQPAGMQDRAVAHAAGRRRLMALEAASARGGIDHYA